MKYLIVTLIRGEAKTKQEELVREVAKRFSVHAALDRAAPPHITLKYSFETEKIAELERTIATFCKSQVPIRYTLDGFGSFLRTTQFIAVNAPVEMEQLSKSFSLELRKHAWIPWKEFDEPNLHFHATVEHSITSQETFKQIGRFLEKKTFYFEQKFDNIAILRMQEGKWVIHKVFEFAAV